ncbi:MAG: hypothetical protein WAW63_03935 [Candidatus Saccharimonadales bacterium]
MGKFVTATSFEKVVVMPQPIAQGSLIGAMAQAVSIEVSNHDLNEELLGELHADIARYSCGSSLSHARTLYYVTGKLYKDEVSDEQQVRMQNFVPLPDGTIPVLVGENSYKQQTDYLGFKAILAEQS